MTTFGWKRKIGQSIANKPSAFEDDDDPEAKRPALMSNSWSLQKKIKMDWSNTKERKDLKETGVKLAEDGKYSDAVKVFDEALMLTPSDAQILEMKAQALLQMNEAFLSLQSARMAISADPKWWVALQTLGRAQLCMGEIKMALTSFSKAVHINPACEELWIEDLKWAHKLLEEKDKLQKQNIDSADNCPDSTRAVCHQNGDVTQEAVPLDGDNENRPDIIQSRAPID